MSVVTVQVGQCGIQSGRAFFDALSDDVDTHAVKRHDAIYCREATERFFRTNRPGERRARAVLVDTEEKVVHDVMKSVDRPPDARWWNYYPPNAIYQKGGSYNNWAFGYSVKGPALSEAVVDVTSREVERCDQLEGILTVGSAAGGTGSGAGVRLLNDFREEWPKSTIVAISVLPYQVGEVVTQAYNTMFTLTQMCDSASAVLLFKNDHLNKVSKHKLCVKNVSFDDLNLVLARTLSSVVQPASSVTEALTLGHLTDAAVSSAAPKLLSPVFGPFVLPEMYKYECPNWKSIFRDLKQESGGSVRSFSDVLITRGLKLEQAETEARSFWGSATHIINHSRMIFGLEMSAACLSNNASVVPLLVNVTRKVRNLYKYKAYVHHYLKFGMEEEEFRDALNKMDDIVASYTE